MKIKLVCILFTMLLFSMFSCSQDAEISDDTSIPKTNGNIKISLKSAGDGKYDLIGYGYDCRYALADNFQGALNPVIDITRLESGQGIDPITGRSVVLPSGKVEVALLHGNFTQYDTYGSTYSSFEQSIKNKITVTMKPGGILNKVGFVKWGKNELSTQFDSDIDRKKTHSFWRSDLCRNVKRIYLSTFSVSRLKYCLTPEFIYALNHSSAKDIVNDFGTHVLTDINVGGKLSVLVSADVGNSTQSSFTSFTSNLMDMISTENSNKAVKTEKLKQVTVSLLQTGGNTVQPFKVVLDENSEIKGDIYDWGAWVNSVTEKTSSLLYSNIEKMIPIWEFIEDPVLKMAVAEEIGYSSISDCNPDILMYRFNLALTVVNNPLANGGHKFVSYQWFGANQKLTEKQGGNKQSITIGQNGLIHNIEYYCIATDETGEVLKTCGFIPTK